MHHQTIKKALIPAAGLGTRMYPATKALKKELLPIIDRDGRAKPIILLIIEEALSAGIEEIGIVIQANDYDLFYELLKSPPKPELWQKLSVENQEYTNYLQEIGSRITLLTQSAQEGFGHAVFCAHKWIDNQTFLLLLGDHIYTSSITKSCAQQLVDIYQQVNSNVIGITTMTADVIQKAGCISGKWQSEDSLSILEIDQIYEKPTLEYARKHLTVSGMAEDEFLGVFGMYILESEIFDLLATEINNNERYKGEFQLTTCLDKLRQQSDMVGYLVQGQYHDTGMPLFYRQTMIDYYHH